MFNFNSMIVAGGTGTGKSYYVIRSVIKQGIENDETLIIHDYNGVFCHEFKEFAESRSYTVCKMAGEADFSKKTILFLDGKEIAKAVNDVCTANINAKIILDEFQNIDIDILKVYQCFVEKKKISIVISVQSMEQIENYTGFIVSNSDTILYLDGNITDTIIRRIFSEDEIRNLREAGTDYMLIHQKNKIMKKGEMT